MSLLGIAGSMGVTPPVLEKLMAGEAGTTVSALLGLKMSSLQEFLDGKAGIGIAGILGTTTATAQELRDRVGREGAIALIIGLCIAGRKK